MAETGVLRPDARVELLGGTILNKSPIGPFHGSITKHLIEIVTAAARRRWILSVQDPVRLDDHSEPQPDLANKIPAYGRAGISDVWIVNLVEEAVEVCREPHFTGYGNKTVRQSANKASPLAFPDVTVDIAELFQR